MDVDGDVVVVGGQLGVGVAVVPSLGTGPAMTLAVAAVQSGEAGRSGVENRVR